MNPWNDSDGYAREAAKVESAGEALLLTLLWWRRAGWTVRAQEPIEQYRIDLFVPEAGVAIEVDSFGGHSSNAAMERDAAKRNLVVARGWAPLSFSCKQTLFDSQDTLAEALSVISARLAVKPRTDGPMTRRSLPGLDVAAAGGRAVIAALRGGHDDLVLSPSHLALANRTAAEYLGIELLDVVLGSPALIRDPDIGATLAAIDGPVALTAAALREALSPAGALDREAFLRTCPALLQPVAVRRLDDLPRKNIDDAKAQATLVLARFGGA